MIGPYSNTSVYRPYAPIQQPYGSYGFQRPVYPTYTTQQSNQQTPLPPPQQPEHSCKKATLIAGMVGALGFWALSAIFDKK